jgi:hypothetical protein
MPKDKTRSIKSIIKSHRTLKQQRLVVKPKILTHIKPLEHTLPNDLVLSPRKTKIIITPESNSRSKSRSKSRSMSPSTFRTPPRSESVPKHTLRKNPFIIPMTGSPRGSPLGSPRRSPRLSPRGVPSASIPTGCANPFLYLQPSSSSLFQVSFSSVSELVFSNLTPDSEIDCGFKTLHALGLRDAATALFDSSLVNHKGDEGLFDSEMLAYLHYIYALPDNSIVYRDEHMGKHSGIMNRVNIKLSELLPKHATLITVEMSEPSTVAGDPDEKWGHYIVAYRDEANILFFYDPQANIPGAAVHDYLTTNIETLMGVDNLIGWGYYTVRARSRHPKKVIHSRLTRRLAWFGGKK